MKILMCKPRFYDIEYEINPWMHIENKANKPLVNTQWQSLHDAYVRNGVIVELIDPIKGLPDMTFTANGGIVFGETFILNNHRHKERKGEEKYFEEWFRKHGFGIHTLSHFQGGEGDALFFRDTLYMGYGFRSDKESHGEVQQILDVPIVSLRLVDPYFYDFDTAFCAVGDKAVLYYPDAFDDEGKQFMKSIKDAIPMMKTQAEHFVGNSVLVGDTLFMGYMDDDLSKKLKRLGVKSEVFDLSEFKKAGGGAKCLTLYIQR